ncbi:MAG TPA: DUF4397 domain-containing protein [Terriglobales bacterium]|nr:DUF4397 domain-containing protein [Terriglobales bacterium]
MPRSVKVLFSAVALVGIAAFAASCGSNNADFRVFNAIATSPNNILGSAFDVWINGSLLYSNLNFGGTQPNTGYKSITSGSDTMEVFQTGTSTNPYINSPLNLGGSNTYTVVLTGTSPTSTSGQSNGYAASVKQDTNTAPTTGNVNIRIINAAINASATVGGGFDVYILPPGTTPSTPGVTPQVSKLTPINASPYVGVSTSGSLTVYVTAPGSRTQINNEPLSGLTATVSIRTIIITDSGGAAYPPLLYTLTDVQ